MKAGKAIMVLGIASFAWAATASVTPASAQFRRNAVGFGIAGAVIGGIIASQMVQQQQRENSRARAAAAAARSAAARDRAARKAQAATAPRLTQRTSPTATGLSTSSTVQAPERGVERPATGLTTRSTPTPPPVVENSSSGSAN